MFIYLVKLIIIIKYSVFNNNINIHVTTLKKTYLVENVMDFKS